MQSNLFPPKIISGFNLRVLIYMNPLVVDKVAKTFLYEKDSGFLYMRQLINKLPPNWKYYILVPKGVKREFFSKIHNIKLVRYDYSTSIHQNRYHFNRNILADLFPYGTDIDVIINNQPEVTANLYAFFQNQRREKPIIINYYHWIDCPESATYGDELSGYIWRQIDGALNGTISMFHGEYAKRLFDKSIESKIGKNLDYRYGFFYPEATKFGDEPMELPKEKIILFNHRLNNSTGWKEVVEKCAQMHQAGYEFKLWLTDDQNLKEKEYLLQFQFIINKKVPFENYGYLMKNSCFSICNTQGYATWNMAVMDCVLNGCLPIIPDNELYHYMFGRDGVYWRDLEQSIIIYLSAPEGLNTALLSEIDLSKDSFNLEGFILEEIGSRVFDKDPAKYEEVKQYIIDNGRVKKSAFVNEYWDFHANSNFQLIRWKLLMEGIIDDTGSHETIYRIKLSLCVEDKE